MYCMYSLLCMLCMLCMFVGMVRYGLVWECNVM